MKIRNYILFKLSAKLLIVASVLCVLLGNGIHIHTVFDHFSDHGHIHAYVHAHNADTTHDSNSGFDEKDDHQHPTASVDFDGTLSPKTVHKVLADDISFTAGGVIPVIYSMKVVNPLYLDLPPPDFLVLSEYFCSLSQRGPPLG